MVNNKLIQLQMNKKEAAYFFQELKTLDKAKSMQLSDVINVLTNGSISTDKAKHFLSSVASNQFGEYGDIYQYIEHYNWKQLTFPQVYQILKHLKDYLKKEKARKTLTQPAQGQQGSIKDMISSFDSKHQENSTVLQIIQHLKETANGADPSSPVLQSSRTEQDFQEKCKHLKFKLIKKLLIVFDFLRKSMHIEGQSFQKNKQISENMDLTMFMKYIKMFELSSTFQPHKIIKAFKANAINTLWLDFDRFVNSNFSMIGLKADLNHEEKYTRLKGFYNLLSSDHIKKMLNVRGKTVLATIVEGHTGTYKQDILDFLQEKLQKRKLKESERWSGKRFKTENHGGSSLERGEYKVKRPVLKSSSLKKLSARTKSQQSRSIYQQLKLPSLRIKEGKNQSIYQSLKRMDLKSEKEKLRNLINIQENEQYLDLYLKEEAMTKDKNKKRPKKLYELPSMKFS